MGKKINGRAGVMGSHVWLGKMLKDCDLEKPGDCDSFFRSSIWFGLMMFAALAAGNWEKNRKKLGVVA
jgi:hypothetical protein